MAIVIDPVRTISAGKVNLGAFRTYPKGYKPPDEGPGEYQTIPLNKIEDFGVHCKSYYRWVWRLVRLVRSPFMASLVRDTGCPICSWTGLTLISLIWVFHHITQLHTPQSLLPNFH